MELFTSLILAAICAMATCRPEKDRAIANKHVFPGPPDSICDCEADIETCCMMPSRPDCRKGYEDSAGCRNVTFNKGDYECVPNYLCQDNIIITDGKGLIDIRSSVVGEGPAPSPINVGPHSQEPLLPIAPPPASRQRGCGRRNVLGAGKLKTGSLENEALFGEIPWMVAILKEVILVDGTKLNIYICGGALIHKNVVLTAAQCAYKADPSILKVRAGEWNSQRKNETYPHQNRSISKIIVHENYYADAQHNDIALLITDQPFEYAENVDITCLPQQDDVILDHHCFASGWGKDTFGENGRYAATLKKIELPMVQRDECVKRLRNTLLGDYFQLHESFVCAGGEFGKDTCKGDGGSPLVCPIPGKKDHYQQVGIVSWGIGCGDENPAVYVNVAKFRNWIDNHMKRLAYRPEYNH